MTIYPNNIRILDAATFTEEHEDVAITPGETDGGYSLSRPRFTRQPRRKWSFRYREMKDEDKQRLIDFWRLVKGRSNLFDWTHPISGEVVTCRFGEMTLKFNRVGFGPLNLWEVDGAVVLEEI